MKREFKSEKDKYFINRKTKRPKNNIKDITNEKSSDEIKSENKTPLKNNIANALILKEKLPITHNKYYQKKT